jgi:uncharacterized protein
MKYFLILVIKLYWLLIPEYKRKNCIFRISCSRFVYNQTKEKGFVAGLLSLKERFQTCRPNHHVKYLENEDLVILRLNNGTVLLEDEISEYIIQGIRGTKPC